MISKQNSNHVNKKRDKNMNTESWCQVESSSKEKWTRTERRHDENAFKSTVFDARSESKPEGRSTSKPKETELDKLARRKHFKQKCTF